jgi:hypothetical protein
MTKNCFVVVKARIGDSIRLRNMINYVYTENRVDMETSGNSYPLAC